MCCIKKINPFSPEPDIIRQAADIIRQGGRIIFPTTCLYGLGTDALNPEAVERIFETKQRSHHKAILVLIQDKKELSALVKHVPPAALCIMDKFWPGKITLVFESKDTLPANLTAGTGKIGVRLAGHPVASALIKAVGSPITGTSANLSGNTGYSRVSDMDSELTDRVDLILDAGQLRGGTGSTVIDVTGDSPMVLREGLVSAKEIFCGFQGTDVPI